MKEPLNVILVLSQRRECAEEVAVPEHTLLDVIGLDALVEDVEAEGVWLPCYLIRFKDILGSSPLDPFPIGLVLYF